MSKAILVLEEMPKNCGECPIALSCKYRVTIGDSKSPYCPLNNMPEEREVSFDDKSQWAAQRRGYNSCIDEILRGNLIPLVKNQSGTGNMREKNIPQPLSGEIVQKVLEQLESHQLQVKDKCLRAPDEEFASMFRGQLSGLADCEEIVKAGGSLDEITEKLTKLQAKVTDQRKKADDDNLAAMLTGRAQGINDTMAMIKLAIDM